MYYAQTVVRENLIEFINNIWGQETVKVNGTITSVQSSITGAQHFFSIVENGETHQYVLQSRLELLQVYIDIYRNGKPEQLGILVTMIAPPHNKFKTNGLNLLKAYKLDQALEEFIKAETLNGYDAEIPLYKACVYSLKEDAANGFHCIAQAVEKKLYQTDLILSLDYLAYLRIHPAFEDFKDSGYKTFVLI